MKNGDVSVTETHCRPGASAALVVVHHKRGNPSSVDAPQLGSAAVSSRPLVHLSRTFPTLPTHAATYSPPIDEEDARQGVPRRNASSFITTIIIAGYNADDDARKDAAPIMTRFGRND